MRSAILFLTAAAIIIFFSPGCEPDKRGIKIAPKAELNPKEEIGYEEKYDSDNSQYSTYGSENAPNEINLITIHFDFDRFELTREALDIMSANAGELVSHEHSVILIQGHCDERGTEEYNLALGEKRAQEVRNYLVKYGIDIKRISIISYGESVPADLGRGEKSWAKNRRAEFIVLSE